MTITETKVYKSLDELTKAGDIGFETNSEGKVQKVKFGTEQIFSTGDTSQINAQYIKDYNKEIKEIQNLAKNVIYVYHNEVCDTYETKDPDESETLSPQPIPIESIRKIKKLAEKIKNRKILNKLYDKTSEHKISNIDKTPMTGKGWAITALVGAVAIVAIIGLGIAVFGVSHLANFHLLGSGISIPGLSATNSLIVGGAVASSLTLALILYKTIISKKILESKNDKNQLIKFLKESIEQSNKIIDHYFLISNVNDAGFIVLYALLGGMLLSTTLAHNPSMILTSEILGYSTGILLIGSGVYQLKESLKSILNAKSKQELIKHIFNFITAMAMTALGVVAIMGILNNKPGIVTNIACGALPIIPNILGLFNARKQKNKLEEIKDKDAITIKKFLEDNLELSEKEVEEKVEKVKAMKKEDIAKWLRDHTNFEYDEAIENSKKIKTKLKDEDLKLKKISKYIAYRSPMFSYIFGENKQKASEDFQNENLNLDEIKQIILKEEIKNAIDEKIETFAVNLKNETLEQLLKFKTLSDKELKEIFTNVYKETNYKFKVEVGKFVAISFPFFAAPIVGAIPKFFLVPLMYKTGLSFGYLGGMTFASITNLSVNTNPILRNLPVPFSNTFLNINNGVDEKLIF